MMSRIWNLLPEHVVSPHGSFSDFCDFVASDAFTELLSHNNLVITVEVD